MPLVETTISVHRPKFKNAAGSAIGGGDLSGDYLLPRPLNTFLRRNRCGDDGKSGARNCAFMRFDFPMPARTVVARSLLTLTAQSTEAAPMTAAFGFSRTRPFGFAEPTAALTDATDAGGMGWDTDEFAVGAYGLNTIRARVKAADATVLGEASGAFGTSDYRFRTLSEDRAIGVLFSELDYSKTVKTIEGSMRTTGLSRPDQHVWCEIWTVVVFDQHNFGFGDRNLYRSVSLVGQSDFILHDDLDVTASDYNVTFTFSPEITLVPGTLYAAFYKTDCDPNGPLIRVAAVATDGSLVFPRDQAGKTGFQIPGNCGFAQVQYPYPTAEGNDTLRPDHMFALSSSAKTSNFTYPATTVDVATTFGDASYSADVVVDLTGLLNFCLQQPEWQPSPSGAIYEHLMPMLLWMSTFSGPNTVFKNWYNTQHDAENSTLLAPTWKIEYEVDGCLVAVPNTFPAVAAESDVLLAVDAQSDALPAVDAESDVLSAVDAEVTMVPTVRATATICAKEKP